MTNDEKLKLEEQILHVLLKHRESVRLFADSPVKATHFDKLHRPLIDAIIDADARNATLTRLTFRDFVNTLGFSPNEVSVQEGVYNRIFSTIVGVKVDDLAMLLRRKRIQYIDTNNVIHLERFRKDRQTDVVAATEGLIENMKATLDEVEQNRLVTFEIIRDPAFRGQWRKELLQKMETDIPTIKCGIPEIDEPMGTGFDQETLTVIVADVGSFKSTLMLNIALGVWNVNKCDILYVPLEMPKFRVYDKMVSCQTMVPVNFLSRPKGFLKPEHIQRIDAFEQRMDGNKGNFGILDVGERTTVSAIRRQIEKHLNYHQPKLVVIDYIANLKGEINRYGRNDLEIGDMLKDLLKMSKKGVVTAEGFGVLTGAQLARKALERLRTERDPDKQGMASEDIQGSHQYSADATSIFGLFKDGPQPRKKLHIFNIKQRYGNPYYEKSQQNRAVLDVAPEYSLIRSVNNLNWESTANDDLLIKVNTMPLSNELDDDAFSDDTVEKETETQGFAVEKRPQVAMGDDPFELLK